MDFADLAREFEESSLDRRPADSIGYVLALCKEFSPVDVDAIVTSASPVPDVPAPVINDRSPIFIPKIPTIATIATSTIAANVNLSSAIFTSLIINWQIQLL